jgi:hypothetical protein
MNQVVVVTALLGTIPDGSSPIAETGSSIAGVSPVTQP